MRVWVKLNLLGIEIFSLTESIMTATTAYILLPLSILLVADEKQFGMQNYVIWSFSLVRADIYTSRVALQCDISQL
jgi:hypothetical protein